MKHTNEKRISKREFMRMLASTGMVAAGLPMSIGGARAAGMTDEATSIETSVTGMGSGDLITRLIPSSQDPLPVIGLGTARTFDINPASDVAMADLQAVLKAHYDGGGRVVDSSPMYGRAEEVVGKLAARLDIANALFMATKVWTNGRGEGIKQMERSRALMRAPLALDLIQIHNLVDTRTHLDTLRGWKKEGLVRYIGATHHTSGRHDELAELCASGVLDFVQFNYNILDRAAENRLLPAAADNGVATLINEPFEKGSLFRLVKGKNLPAWATEAGIQSWGQFFLKFIIGHPAVTCAIPATSKAKHATDNIGAAHGIEPDAGLRAKMAAHYESL